jgi:hypothetical protein
MNGTYARAFILNEETNSDNYKKNRAALIDSN